MIAQGSVNANSTPNDYFPQVAQQELTTWKLEKFPLKVLIPSGAAGRNPDGRDSSVSQSLRDAFNQWQAASKNRYTFQFTNSKDACDIDCQFVSEPKGMHNEWGVSRDSQANELAEQRRYGEAMNIFVLAWKYDRTSPLIEKNAARCLEQQAQQLIASGQYQQALPIWQQQLLFPMIPPVN